MIAKQIQTKFSPSTLLLAALALGAGGLVSLMVAGIERPLYLFLLAAGLLAGLGMLFNLELGLLVLVFITYTRFSDVMIQFHDAPSVAKLLVPALFLLVLGRWLLFGERPAGWQRPALLMGAYGLVSFISLLYAADPGRVEVALITYVKDAMIVVAVALLLQRATALRRVIWVLLAAAIFLGTISVYQQLTGTFENVYGGFGQAKIRNIVTDLDDYRISGPLGGPNEYAQMMVALVPLALDRLWNERRPLLRLLAAWALAASILTIIFTFSRGGFIALAVVLVIMFVRRPPNLLTLLVTALLVIPLLQFVPPEYTDRLRTLAYILPGSPQQAETDVAFRGRLSENTSAIQMFVERPVFGVGLDNFPIHYQRYSRELGLDNRREIRSAHSLYLQIASEQGLAGLAIFGVVFWFVFKGLHQAGRDFERASLADAAQMTTALGIGIIGFLTAGIVLHLIYPRFLWLLVGIALAAPMVARRELAHRHLPEETS